MVQKHNKMPKKEVKITFTIHGGNNQILPNATHAVQNFYSNVPSPLMPEEEDAVEIKKTILEKTAEPEQWEPAQAVPQKQEKEEETYRHLSSYINNEELYHYYKEKLKVCLQASDIAKVAVEMAMNEDIPRIDRDEIVKERFFKLLPPLCSRLIKKTSHSNLRQRINDILVKLPGRK